MCDKEPETIVHKTSGLAKADYIERHNKAAAYLQCPPKVLKHHSRFVDALSPLSPYRML